MIGMNERIKQLEEKIAALEAETRGWQDFQQKLADFMVEGLLIFRRFAEEYHVDVSDIHIFDLIFNREK